MMTSISFNIEAFYRELDKLFSSGDGGAIQKFLEQAWNVVQDTDDEINAIAVANELGGWYRAKGYSKQAKELYVDALKSLENIDQKYTDNYATTLINFGDVFVSNGEYKEAIEIFLDAEEILNELNLENDYRMAALKNNISAAYRELGEYQKAEMNLAKAWEILSLDASTSVDKGTTLINLAQLQIKQGKLESAEENLTLCLTLLQDIPNENDPHKALALSSLGEVYYYQKNYERAEHVYEEALAIIIKAFGKTLSYDIVNESLLKVRELRADKV